MTEETVTAEMPVDAPLPETPEPEVQAQAVETEVPDDAGTEPHEEKPKGGFQRRIKEVTDDRNYWRELAMRNAQQEQQKPVEAPKAVETKLPTLEEYGYDEAKYQVALLEYADRRAEAVVERRLSQAEQQRAEQARFESFATRQRDFAKATPDFEDKVLRDPTLPITAAMRDVIVDSPTGPEIAYYLANNREAAEAIANLPPHLAALEMGRIEGRLSALKEVKTRPVPVVSKAPPPPPKVEEADVAVDKNYMDDSTSMKDWLKWREKNARRAR